jgi:hypothetical protein
MSTRQRTMIRLALCTITSALADLSSYVYRIARAPPPAPPNSSAHRRCV